MGLFNIISGGQDQQYQRHFQTLSILSYSSQCTITFNVLSSFVTDSQHLISTITICSSLFSVKYTAPYIYPQCCAIYLLQTCPTPYSYPQYRVVYLLHEHCFLVYLISIFVFGVISYANDVVTTIDIHFLFFKKRYQRSSQALH